MTKENQWCFSWLANNPAAGGNDRAAFLRASMWPRRSIIRIVFLEEGDDGIQDRVRTEAIRWTVAAGGPANLTFNFVENAMDADIRISFSYKGSWSVLGTTCKSVPRPQPTMNFGWLNAATPADALRRVVLHEFGHAIGMVHEHLSPEQHIDWNRQAVYDDLRGPPNNWDDATIDRNMFATFAAQEMNASMFDRQSIMLYPIPPAWTNDGFSSGLNSTLSDLDISYVRQQYP